MFLLILVTSMKVIVHIVPNHEYQALYNDAKHISELLMTKGLPENWNETNAVIPGIISSQRLNITKLAEFDKIDYELSKPLLQTESEYIFFFKNKTSTINITKCIRGYNITTDNNCNFDINQIPHDNLVNIERFLVYNGEIIQLKLYAWN